MTTRKKGARETRANSIGRPIPLRTEMRNTMDNVEQSTGGASRTSYGQSSRKVIRVLNERGLA